MSGRTLHVNDAESGLVYMQQRYYDPVAGRFLSVDPVTTDAKTGSSFNRYAYGNNNPYKFTDPDGRDPRLVAIGVIALGSGLIQGVGSAIAAPSGEKTGAFFSGLAIGTLSGAVAATTALTGVSLAGKGLAMTIEGSAKGALSVAAGATAQVAGQGLAAAATAVDATSTAGAPRPTQAPQGSNTDKSGSAGQSSKGPSQEGAKPKQEEPKVSK